MHKLLIPIILILVLPLLITVVREQTSFFSKASVSLQPQLVLVGNISDSSFSVTWLTAKAATGFIQYGLSPDKLDNSISDDRDSNGRIARSTHIVSPSKLNPNSTYYFKIGSGAKVYDDKGKPFSQKTAPTLVNPPVISNFIFGKVQTKDNKPPAEAILYILAKNGTTLAVPVQSDGTWVATLNNIRTLDLENLLELKDQSLIDGYIEGGKNGSAEVKLTINSDKPQPVVTLNPQKVTIGFEK